MKEEFVKKFKEIREFHIEKFGEESFSDFAEILLLRLNTIKISKEIEFLGEFYINEQFKNSKVFYENCYKVDAEEANILNNQNSIIDELNLQFYVIINHKLENYENEILTAINLHTKKRFKNLKDYDLDVHEKKQLFNDRDRIRLIANSIKHNNFYPKITLQKYYPHLKIDQKLMLKDFNPRNDLELIKHHLNYFNLLVFSLLIKYSIIELQTFNIEFDTEIINIIEKLFADENYKSEEYISYHINK